MCQQGCVSECTVLSMDSMFSSLLARCGMRIAEVPRVLCLSVRRRDPPWVPIAFACERESTSIKIILSVPIVAGMVTA